MRKSSLKLVLKVVKNFKTNLIIIAISLVIIYFLPLETPTGFVVNENSVLDPEVQEKAFYEGEVDVIVKLKDVEGKTFIYDNREADINTIKEEIIGEIEEKHDFDELDSFAGKITKEGLKTLERHPNVEVVQVDHIFDIELQDSVPLIKANKLHQVGTDINGTNVGVCILDTGVNYNHIYLSVNYKGGYDYVNDDADPLDDHGHGTHVTGIVKGVAPGANLLHVKVLNSAGSGSESDIVAGINWCVTNKDIYKIKVITMSLGAGLYTDFCDNSFLTLASAVNNAVANDINVVASSGNSGSSTGISSPGCIDNVTAVGATDKNDNLASYSNLNSLVKLVAPGSSINSTAISGGFTLMSGTSMAAPHVAGSFVLLQQYKYESEGGYYSVTDAEQGLIDNGVSVSGYKRVDPFSTVSNLDNVAPSLILISPKSITYSENEINLSYLASDKFLDLVYYNLNGTNTTVSGNTTLPIEGGSHTLTLYAEDGNNNLNFTSVSFIVGLPSVTLNSPKNSFNDIDGLIEFNCSLYSDAGVANISLYHNSEGTFSFIESINLNGKYGEGIFNRNFSSNTSLTWNCLGYDLGGNFDWGENRTLRIDINNAPLIESYEPNITNVTILEPAVQEFNVSFNDSDGDSVNVSWHLNNAYKLSEINYSIGGNYFSSGVYDVLALVTDEYGLNDSYNWSFTVLNTEHCGDDVKNATEECDGSNYGGKSCASYGYTKGNLICSSCSIDRSGCNNGTSSGGASSGGGSGTEDRTEETLQAFSDLQESREFEDEELGEEIIIEDEIFVEAESNKPETGEAVFETQDEEKKYGWLYGVGAVLIGGAILFLFLMKEWKIIMSKKK